TAALSASRGAREGRSPAPRRQRAPLRAGTVQHSTAAFRLEARRAAAGPAATRSASGRPAGPAVSATPGRAPRSAGSPGAGRLVTAMRHVTLDLRAQSVHFGLQHVELATRYELEPPTHVVDRVLCALHGIARSVLRAVRRDVAAVAQIIERLLDGILERAEDAAYGAYALAKRVTGIRAPLSLIRHAAS